MDCYCEQETLADLEHSVTSATTAEDIGKQFDFSTHPLGGVVTGGGGLKGGRRVAHPHHLVSIYKFSAVSDSLPSFVTFNLTVVRERPLRPG